MSYSPAQMLFSRRLRDVFPSVAKLLEPKVVNPREELQSCQAHSKHYFDRGTRELESLLPGDHVRVRQGKTWEPAVVITMSYEQLEVGELTLPYEQLKIRELTLHYLK